MWYVQSWQRHRMCICFDYWDPHDCSGATQVMAVFRSSTPKVTRMKLFCFKHLLKWKWTNNHLLLYEIKVWLQRCSKWKQDFFRIKPLFPGSALEESTIDVILTYEIHQHFQSEFWSNCCKNVLYTKSYWWPSKVANKGLFSALADSVFQLLFKKIHWILHIIVVDEATLRDSSTLICPFVNTIFFFNS